MKKIFILLLLSMIIVSTEGCAQKQDVITLDDPSVELNEMSEMLEQESENSEEFPNEKENSNELADISGAYHMEVYTIPPNDVSTINIEYPVFEESELDELNDIIFAKVLEQATMDSGYYEGNEAMMVNQRAAVTLCNQKMISIVFWGKSCKDMSVPTKVYTHLYTINVDVRTMKQVTIKDLYNVQGEFSAVFFEKAYFPENPITSYEEERFAAILKLQTPEYTPFFPLEKEWSCCFLKPEGIVFSMPAVHASGNDHFEAELKYEDIQEYYLLEQNYWEN